MSGWSLPTRKDFAWALALTFMGCALGLVLNAYIYSSSPFNVRGINLKLALGLDNSPAQAGNEP